MRRQGRPPAGAASQLGRELRIWLINSYVSRARDLSRASWRVNAHRDSFVNCVARPPKVGRLVRQNRRRTRDHAQADEAFHAYAKRSGPFPGGSFARWGSNSRLALLAVRRFVRINPKRRSRLSAPPSISFDKLVRASRRSRGYRLPRFPVLAGSMIHMPLHDLSLVDAAVALRSSEF